MSSDHIDAVKLINRATAGYVPLTESPTRATSLWYFLPQNTEPCVVETEFTLADIHQAFGRST